MADGLNSPGTMHEVVTDKPVDDGDRVEVGKTTCCIPDHRQQNIIGCQPAIKESFVFNGMDRINN